MADTNDLGTETRIPTIKDLARTCYLLNEAGARYIVIGGMAMIYHGYTRTTEDIDLLVDPSEENIKMVKIALEQLPDSAAKEIYTSDILEYTVVRVADEFVVDLMAKACDVDFEQASQHIEYTYIEGVRVPFLNAETLLKTKQGVRPKDQQDALFLKGKLEYERNKS